MSVPGPGEITQILQAMNAGDRDAVHQLFPLVYNQLRRMARARMAREEQQTLQTTALVHEVYLRLLKEEQPGWENKRHFFTVAAEAMRRILVENARRRNRLKRGGNYRRVPFYENTMAIDTDPDLFLMFDQALQRLSAQDAIMTEVVKLRCFAGLTVPETALALGISPRNTDRYWSAAKAWLHNELQISEKKE